MILKNTVGTVNFTDWLHVTASKVSDPGVIIWEDWFDAPLSNFNFTIPVGDADNYYVRFYDAPTNASLGTLHLELIVNALTGETILERRWYLVDGPGDHDPVDGATKITDPYFIGKTIYGVFKEGFRYLKPVDEYTFNDTTGEIENISSGAQFATGERIMVEIQYPAAQTTTSASGGLYTGTIEVADEERTLIIDELNSRIVCVGSTVTQKFLLPALAGVTEESGYYFDNSVKGTAVQPKILCNGTDKILFNGFMAGSDLFEELWVSRGEHVLIRKRAGFWEVITDYKGTNVGERIAAGFNAHPNTVSENGQLMDGDEYPRIWWWLNNVLPSTHKYTDDTIESGGWAPTASRIGQFALHSTLKKFRMPKTGGLSEKGLANFESYGSDSSNRPIDYPGGFQDHMLLEHDHGMPDTYNESQPGTRVASGGTTNEGANPDKTKKTGGVEQRVKNFGVVYLRRI